MRKPMLYLYQSVLESGILHNFQQIACLHQCCRAFFKNADSECEKVNAYLPNEIISRKVFKMSGNSGYLFTYIIANSVAALLLLRVLSSRVDVRESFSVRLVFVCNNFYFYILKIISLNFFLYLN